MKQKQLVLAMFVTILSVLMVSGAMAADVYKIGGIFSVTEMHRLWEILKKKNHGDDG